jgi:hypothetical protein
MAQNSAAFSPYHAHLAPSGAGFGSSPASSVVSAPDQIDVTAIPVDSAAAAPAAAPAVPKARPRLVDSVSLEYARCDLCGEPLGSHAGHFPMVSPLTARHVSVCRTCRRAALSEGYRPRA